MAQSKLSLTALKKYLKTCSQEELTAEISALYKGVPAVKDYYQVKLHPQSELQVAEKYKKIIENEFFPTRGFGKARLSVARKAVNDYKKLTASAASVADIKVFYVEQGVRFTNAYGDIDEPFYNSMESMYATALEWIAKHDLQKEFQSRCKAIVCDTSGIGWGFHDGLNDLYTEAYGSG